MRKLESKYKLPAELSKDEIVGRYWRRSQRVGDPSGTVYVYKEKGGHHYTWAAVRNDGDIRRGETYSTLR